MPTRLGASFVCPLIASWAIACGDPSSAPTEQAPKETPRVLELGERQLVVEEAGQSPRRQLRHAGAHERRVRIGVSQRDSAADGGKVLPTFLVLELNWRGQVPTEGPAVHEFAMKAVEHPTRASKGAKKPTPPEIAEAQRTMDAAFLRVQGRIRIEAGQPSQIVANRDHVRLTPDIPTVLDLFLLPLPSTEVGVGARWVTTDSKSKERRAYTLAGLDGTNLIIDFERTSPEDSRSSLPNIRGRFEMRATAGAELSTLLLSDPLPMRGRLEFELEGQHFGRAGDRTVQMVNVLELDTPP